MVKPSPALVELNDARKRNRRWNPGVEAHRARSETLMMMDLLQPLPLLLLLLMLGIVEPSAKAHIFCELLFKFAFPLRE